jgi:hypothetical protein
MLLEVAAGAETGAPSALFKEFMDVDVPGRDSPLF